MTGPRSPQRGAILILVLIAIAAVAVVASMMLREVSVEYTSSASVRETVTGGPALDSGLLMAADMLMQDKSDSSDKSDDLLEDWAHFDEALAQLNGSLEGMRLSGNIEDEAGRFPLRALISNNTSLQARYRGIFTRLLQKLHAALELESEMNPTTLYAAIRDWVSSTDSSVGDDIWYHSRVPPYSRRGDWFQSPEELLLLRWPDVDPEDFRTLLEGRGEIPGLRDLVTVWGKGPINMNTAPPALVLAVAPYEGSAVSFMEAVKTYRTTPGNDLSLEWHTPLAANMGMDPGQYPGGCLGQTSTLFRIHLEARRGLGVRRHTAVVEVSSATCNVLVHKAH